MARVFDIAVFASLCFLVLGGAGCSLQRSEGFEPDFSNPEKTLRTFFRAGHEGRIPVVASCFMDWDTAIVRTVGYRDFVDHIRMETRNSDFRLFKVGRKDDLVELGIEITLEKPFFRRRDFYYFDYHDGKWLIVTSGWMKELGCG